MSSYYSQLELEKVLTETKIAEQFKDEFKSEIRYCTDTGQWLAFDGIAWKETINDIELRKRLGVSTNNYYNKHLPRCADEKQEVKFQKFINKSLKTNTARQILAHAQIFEEIQIAKKDFDNHPTLLAVQNGTVDLKTGELNPSDPSDYITRVAATKYDKSKDCPKFKKFIYQISGGSKELENYILSILSYCMTGLSWEQEVYFFHGLGANGKTLLLEIIRSILGNDLVVNARSSLLLKKGPSKDSDIARLKGARLVTCFEIGEDDTIDDALLKRLSGGDQVTGRALYKNPSEFKNTSKIIAATNVLPDFEGTDYGIERRLKVIPFVNKVEGDQVNKQFLDELKIEKEGILALLVENAKKYFDQGGITIPSEVDKATKAYLASGNSMKCFYADCCDKTTDRSKENTLNVTYNMYVKYCQNNSLKICSPNSFTKRLMLMGHQQRKSGSHRYWIGLMVDMNKSSTIAIEESVPQIAEPSIAENPGFVDESTGVVDPAKIIDSMVAGQTVDTIAADTPDCVEQGLKNDDAYQEAAILTDNTHAHVAVEPVAEGSSVM